MVVRGGGAGSVLTPGCGVVDARQHDRAVGGRRFDDGRVAAGKTCGPAAPLRPGKLIHQRALPGLAERTGHHLQHEPCGRGLGQLGNGELLQFAENRKSGMKGLSDACRG